VYGDETTADIRANVLNAVAAQIPFLKPYIDTLNGGAPINVSRTGYTEKEVVDPNTINFKLSGAMHYKITDNLEAVVAGFFGTGNTVYTGSDRYSLRELKMSQYKVELNSKNWFIRGWTTQENAGESYNATVTTRLFNEAWKPSGGSTGWYAQYGQSYLANRMAGMSDQAAHTASRALADVGRPASGSQQFREIFDRIRKVPISDGGGLFVDKTDLYALEGQYNLSDLFNNKLDVLIGGNFRQFILNSEGTLFADTAGTIKIKEGGAYLQLGKSIFNDNLRLLASVRFDKNENFDGRFTPRVTALWKVAQDHNIRFSYQTAYRFPSTQQQYIDLVVGQGVRLIGGTDFMLNKYGINETPSYTINSFQSYAASVQRGQPNPSLLKTVSFPKFNAEYVNSFEVGYKGLMANKKLLVDLYAYYGMYNNFVVRTVVAKTYSNLAPGVPDPRNNYIFSVPTNLDGNVSTYGAGLSLDYSLSRGYYINANLTTDYLQEVPEGYVAFFNAPKYRAVLGVGNVGFGPKKRLGFNVSMRWQDGFLYESDFATGQIPSATVFDGQVSYRVPEKKLLFRLGGTNIANSYYRNSFGNPEIGGMYYFSIGYNL
jgi:outer membrane receptor protein involved in Fe transport